jgi:histidine triad (HIT) family protein
MSHHRTSCPFCDIAAGATVVPKLYDDHNVVAFMDRSPQASVHALIIPKVHYDSVVEMTGPVGAMYLGHMAQAATLVANHLGLAENGFRLVMNTGKAAGQTVKHAHMHMLASEDLGPMVSQPPTKVPVPTKVVELSALCQENHEAALFCDRFPKEVYEFTSTGSPEAKKVLERLLLASALGASDAKVQALDKLMGWVRGIRR